MSDGWDFEPSGLRRRGVPWWLVVGVVFVGLFILWLGGLA